MANFGEEPSTKAESVDFPKLAVEEKVDKPEAVEGDLDFETRELQRNLDTLASHTAELPTEFAESEAVKSKIEEIRTRYKNFFDKIGDQVAYVLPFMAFAGARGADNVLMGLGEGLVFSGAVVGGVYAIVRAAQAFEEWNQRRKSLKQETATI